MKEFQLFVPVSLETAVWRWLGKLTVGASRSGELAPETRTYLSPSNPVLTGLKARYAAVGGPEHSFWSFWEAKINLLKFRGESDYLSQAYFRNTQKRYELTSAYVEMIDADGWLRYLTEDRLFGVKTWDVLPGVLVTRDLLDSIIELHFLKEALGWKEKDDLRVLDIGAGYGRFAHRFVHLFPRGQIDCIDAIATSTFLCQFYLEFRGCAAQAHVVPFDRRSDLKSGAYSLALNVHSWSECSLPFVREWLGLLRDLRVPYLFIVPHRDDLTTKETDGSSKPYFDAMRRCGFRLVRKQRKFARSIVVDRAGIFPTNYYLFERG
jgi:SAM-dependent methyltransferase